MCRERAIVDEYVNSILSGDIPSCLMIRKSCERWLHELERDDLYFDDKEFAKFCSFARQFRHYKGDMAGQFFNPEPWQLFIAANIIGLKIKATGKRKYTYADIYVPRKNGKTFLAAIFAAWFMMMDGEAGAEVYTAAVDKDQAKLCYDASVTMIQNSIFDSLVKVTPSKNLTECPRNHAVFKPLSKETKNKDGLNIHAAICDERHAWPNNDIYDVIKTGMGARSQPMLLSISTAGTDTSNPYFRDIEAYKEIMLGIKEKDNHFLMLFTPDEGDRWDDEATWRKVNPNYGISLSPTYMKNECNEAKLRGGTYQIAFQTKNLNQWVDAPDVWISDDDVKACNKDFDVAKLVGEDCYVGIDLASKSDICAVAFFFPKYKFMRYLFVLPEDKVQNRDDRVDYRKWVEDGWIVQCPNKVLDEAWWMERLFLEMQPYNIKCIAFDPWGMWDLKNKFGKYQDKLMEYQQSIRYMSVPTKWLESAVLKKEINFGYNPVIRWMMRNVVVYVDPNANVKLDKARSRNKIDGVVASVDAIGGWLNLTNGKSQEIYTDHELRCFSL